MKIEALLCVMIAITAMVLSGCSVSSADTIERTSQPISTRTQQPLAVLKVGEPAPPYEVMTIKGIILNNGSFETPMLLYFFTTWCQYCKEDLDTLSKVYLEYEEDVSIVAIDMDLKEDAALIGSYAARFPALGSVWFALGNVKVLSAYQIKYTTTKYAIDGEGNVLYAGTGALTEGQWKTMLDAMKKP